LDACKLKIHAYIYRVKIEKTNKHHLL